MACEKCGKVHEDVIVPAGVPTHYWRRGLWSIVQPATRDLVNLVTNPSFEFDLLDWDVGPGTQYQITDDDAWRGVYSMILEPLIGGSMYSVSTDNLPAAAGEYTCASMMVKGCAGDRLQLDLGAEVLSPAVALQVQAGQTVAIATGEWQKIRTCMYNGLGGAVMSQLRLMVTPHRASCAVTLVDAVSVVSYPTAEDVDYFDGDQPGAVWDGDPNASMSRAPVGERRFGFAVDLNALGFELIGDEGWGMPPVEPVVISYARRPGAHYQGTHVLPRTIRLIGMVEGESCAVHGVREALVKAVGLWDIADCGQEFYLRYQHVNGCGVAEGQVLEIPVSYAGGLEGVRRDLYRQRIDLELVAHEYPLWRSMGDSCQFLQPGLNQVINSGSATAAVKIEFRGPGVIRSVKNNSTSSNLSLVHVDGGVVTPGIEAAFIGARVIFDSRPGNVSLQRWPGPTEILGAIDYTKSRPARWRLRPGANEIEVDMDDGELIICWRETHLSADGVAASLNQLLRNCGKREKGKGGRRVL